MRQLIFLIWAICAALPAVAQSPFAEAIRVNDEVITYWELEQRTKLYEVLGAPEDPATFARKQLIDDRLKQSAAELAGIRVTEAEIDAGVADLAGRGGLDAAAFLARLAQGGVAEETLRDFVQASLAWRGYVRERFRGRAQVSEADIDEALATASDRGSVRLNLAEIIIPTPDDRRAEAQAIAERISGFRSNSAFSAAAREYSATATRDQGGVLGWRDASELPPGLVQLLLQLRVGEVTRPLDLQGRALALFQLRGLEEVPAPPARVTRLDWAELAIAGGHTEAARAEALRIGQQADSCIDLFGATFGEAPGRVVERSDAPANIPNDILTALAVLDPGEISTSVTREEGNVLLLLMLCDRETTVTQGASRDDIRNQLLAQRLSLMAEAHLKGLRGDARIRP